MMPSLLQIKRYIHELILLPVQAGEDGNTLISWGKVTSCGAVILWHHPCYSLLLSTALKLNVRSRARGI
jgi:hypothetical protein